MVSIIKLKDFHIGIYDYLKISINSKTQLHGSLQRFYLDIGE